MLPSILAGLGAADPDTLDADHLAPVFDERFKDEVVDFLRRIDG